MKSKKLQTKRLLLAFVLGLASAARGAERPPSFVTDPNSPELQELAKPLAVDESQYGCGPLLRPGKTYYASLDGDDDADGLSWDSAWRHLHIAVPKLGPGDTLVVGEGEYVEPTIKMNVETEQSGEV